MVQTTEEIVLLELGEVVQGLYISATLEGKTFEGSEYNHGRIAAYKIVYDILQRVSKLDGSEFDRKIDERKASKTLGLDKYGNGKYEIVFMEGRITTLISSELAQRKRDQK